MRFHIVDQSGLFRISTAFVFDREEQPYETAIMINRFEMKIVELYNTKDEANIGHEKWVEKAKDMTMEQYNNIQTLVEDYLLMPSQVASWRKREEEPND